MDTTFSLRALALLAAGVLALVSCRKPQPEPVPPATALEPANCFIITKPGVYNFKTVKGNSTESVGKVAKAEVLWESFGTTETPPKGVIIAETGYVDGKDLIRFSTQLILKDGNAVIAAKDASGNILWSWHVWVCKDWNPEATAHTYYKNAGVIMDRNLGATSATPGDVASLGLLYQWGRKDPFLGGGSLTENIEAASTLKWPEPVLSTAETGTIAYAIAHPTTFIASMEDSFDWYYTGVYDTDNTRWQEDKNIYDPCPAGWKLPVGPTDSHNGFWSTAVDVPFTVFPMFTGYPGIDFTKLFGDAGSIWYPFTGFRTDMEGELTRVGVNAGVWTSTPDLDENDPNAKVMAFGLDISITSVGDIMVFYAADYYRAFGHSVRCVKE